jgi:tRNA modification GTPase
VLALVTASDAEAAQRALIRLRGDLGADLAAVRDELTELRARVEAGLDFAEEDGVAGADHRLIRSAAQRLGARLARWRTVADAAAGPPVVCLVGPANAGKSALFQRLSGAPALVSPVPGTTRDPLEAAWHVGSRTVTLVDTAGWLDHASTGLDAEAIAAGRRWIDHAALVLACSAPDARLPTVAGTWQVIATKADLGSPDPRAVVAVSVETGCGLDQLAGLVAERLAHSHGGEPRQQGLLAAALASLGTLADQPPPDEMLAEDLRRITEQLSDLIGSTTPDDVLDALFSRFCIGK